MYLEKLLLKSFGKLRGEFIFPSSPLAVFYAPSSFGKTTLAAAIAHLFYADHSATANSEIGAPRLLAACRPFADSEFSATANVQIADGENLTVWRDFHGGQTLAIDAVGENLLRDGNDFGEKFCALSAAEFCEFALICADKSRPPINGFFSDAAKIKIIAKIQNRQKATDAEWTRAEKELAELTKIGDENIANDSLSAPDSAIRKKRLSELENELARLAANASEKETAYREAESRTSDLAQKREQLAMAEWRDLTEKIAEISAEDSRREKVKQEIAAAELELSAFTESTESAEAAASFDFSESARLAELQKKFDEQQSAWRRAERELNAQRELRGQDIALEKAELSREELEESAALYQKLPSLQQRENALRLDLQAAQSPFTESGISAEELAEFSAQVETMNADDGEFFWNFFARTQDAQTKNDDLSTRHETHLAHEKMLADLTNREMQAARRHWLGAIALTIVGGGLVALIASPLYWLALAIGGSTWLGYGLYRRQRAQNFYRQMRGEMSAVATEIQQTQNAVAEQIAADNRRFADLTRDFSDDPKIRLQKIAPRRVEFNFWRECQNRLAAAVAEHSQAIAFLRNKIAPTFLPSEVPISAAQWKFYFDENWRRLRQAEQSAAAQVAMIASSQNLTTAQNELEATETEIANLLTRSGITKNAENTDWRELARTYESAEKQRWRRDNLREEISAAKEKIANEKISAPLNRINLEIWNVRRDHLLAVYPSIAEAAASSENFPEMTSDDCAILRIEIANGDRNLATARADFLTAKIENENRGADLIATIENEKKSLADADKNWAEKVARQRELTADIAVRREAWREIFNTRFNAQMKAFFPDWRFAIDDNLQIGAARKNGQNHNSTEMFLTAEKLQNILASSEWTLLAWARRILFAELLASPLVVMDEPLGDCDFSTFCRAFTDYANHLNSQQTATAKTPAANSANLIFTSHQDRAEHLKKLGAEIIVFTEITE